MGTHCFSTELYFCLSPTGLCRKHKKKYDGCMLCRTQNIAMSPLLQSTLRRFLLQLFCMHVLHVLMYLLPLYLCILFFSFFFFLLLNDCSCWFHCLWFYCLKLEQMVICLLNTKLCHTGIIITAELAPCKSGFILWNRLKDSEEIHCTAGCQCWAEWMVLLSWPKIQCRGIASIVCYRFTTGFCTLQGNAVSAEGQLRKWPL